jgi:glycopeptide antibiotics resistance protein
MVIRIKPIKIVFLIYIMGVLTLTFIIRETMIFRLPDNRGLILEPFREVEAFIHQPNHLFWFMQIFLNILLFVPLGFMLPLLSNRFRNPKVIVLTGFMFSGAIEAMQYITGRGLTEIDDVINNTAGALVGFIMYQVFMHIYRKYIEYSYY